MRHIYRLPAEDPKQKCIKCGQYAEDIRWYELLCVDEKGNLPLSRVIRE